MVYATPGAAAAGTACEARHDSFVGGKRVAPVEASTARIEANLELSACVACVDNGKAIRATSTPTNR